MNARFLGFFALAPFGLLSAAGLATRAQSPLPHLDDPANLAGERVSAPDLADTLPINHGAPALEQLLRRLRTRASFMLIVAHPDDEDGGMLTYLSRGQGARVAMLTLTRGEGGQNLMSADFDDALGLIRTQELLAADRYMGVDQFFGTEVDFGFSKTKEEAFAQWTHERVLYDAVRAVRLYRPLVIASVFIGAPTDGHGHHQVAGEIAQEVFKAAGDPNVFPDQIAQGLQPWQPLKVYARIPFARIDAQGMFDYATNQYAPPRFQNYVTGKVTDTVPQANVAVPEGTTDALLGGLSYVQFAREGLALQKTQIGGGARLARPGAFDVQYHRYGSRVLGPNGKPQPDDGDGEGLESGFFAGIDTSLPGMASLAPGAPPALKAVLQLIDGKIDEAQKNFDPTHLSAIAEPLRIALQTLDTVISGTEGSSLPANQKANLLHELRIKRVQLNDALVLALGVTLNTELETTRPNECAKAIFPGCIAHVNTIFTNGPASPITALSDFTSFTGVSDHERTWAHPLLKPGETLDPSRSFYEQLWPPPTGPNVVVEGAHSDPFALKQAEGRPYFTRGNFEQPYYDLEQPSLRLAPMTPRNAFWTRFSYEGVELLIGHQVTAATAPGETGAPLVLEPPYSLSFQSRVHVIPQNTRSFSVTARIRDLTGKPSRALPAAELTPPTGWQATAEAHTESTTGVASATFSITRPQGSPAGTITATCESVSAAPVSDTIRAVGYPGITSTNYYTPATLRVIPVDVTTAPSLNIAYLPGTGDDVPSALADLGVTPHTITVADLTPQSLKQYDAVVLGVRAYEAHSDLGGADAALNNFAASGGVVIVQYNAGRMPANAGPYPLSLGSAEKVVEEDAPVAILDPDDPLLTWPNRITQADFSGWVEERGHGFMGSWDAHYKALLETHDPGQQPQQGGLLVARIGKGAWIYVALALYRQLPEGVPGSYRLLANLISAGKEPASR